MKTTLCATDLRTLTNPREFARDHFATLKKVVRKAGTVVPGYQDSAEPPRKDGFVPNWQRELSTFLITPRLVPSRKELMLHLEKPGIPPERGHRLDLSATFKSSFWKKEMISVTSSRGQDSLVTKIVKPRLWAIGHMEIHQVKLPSDCSLPPVYSKRSGSDMKLEEATAGQEGYPRQMVWDMLDTAKGVDGSLKIPERSYSALANSFMHSMFGVQPDYWDGEIER